MSARPDPTLATPDIPPDNPNALQAPAWEGTAPASAPGASLEARPSAGRGALSGPTGVAGPAGLAGLAGAAALLPLDLTLQCMRCGFCLDACPTYRLTGKESQSPRGRIALVRAAAEGVLEPEAILDPLDKCIGCRACEVACPAGVEYGRILESSRALLESRRPRSLVFRWVRRVALSGVLGSPAGIRRGAALLRLYQRSGLQRLARATGLLRAIAPHLADMEAVLPPAGPKRHRATGAAGRPAGVREVPPVPEVRQVPHAPATSSLRGPAPDGAGSDRPVMTVAFFGGCVQEMAFGQVNQAAIRVLRAAGCRVIVPPGAGCCGAVHAHAGEHHTALEQAKRNIAAFEASGADVAVHVAGGCGAALKEYGQWLAGETQDGPSSWAERARHFSARVRDINELLATLELPPMGELHGTVTYQDSCHLRNVQKVWAQPRSLLKRIPGLRFVELPEADRCCGAGGIYNLMQPELSAQVLAEKMAHVAATGADILAVSNTPCHLQLLVGTRRHGLDRRGLRVLHVVELLDEAISAGQRPGERSQMSNGLHGS